MGGAPAGMNGTPPAGMNGNATVEGMGAAPGGNHSSVSSNTDLALAAGYVVVEPGCRGRHNQAEDGTY